MRRILFFLVPALCAATPVFSQKLSPEDSLLKVLDHAGTEKEKGQTYYLLASEIVETKPQAAITYAQKGMEIARKISDTALIIRCDIQQGIANDNLGNIADAFKFHNEALNLAQKTRNEFLQASCYINIGMVYSHSGDSSNRQKELDSYRKALEIQQRVAKEDLANTYMDIGTAFFDMAQYDSSLVYYNIAITLAQKENQQGEVAYAYNNIGTAYYMQKKYDRAAEYFEKAKLIKQLLGDKKGLASSYANLGEMYGTMGEYEKAIQNLDSGLSFALMIRNKEYIMAIHQMRFTVYANKKDYQSALEAYKLYIAYKDSVFDSQKAKDILDIQNKYETTQKQRENELLKQTNIVQQENLHRKDQLNYVVSAGLALVLAGAFFIFRAYSQKKKANLLVNTQKAALEQKNKDITDSITYAKKIQGTLLAGERLLRANLPEHFVLFQPKDIVSGDFYWGTLNGDNFYLAVCDSTGHGVPGAFMSLLNVSFLNEAIAEKKIAEPHAILEYVRTRLIESVSKDGMHDGMDGILLRIDRKTNAVTYAAAHNSPALVHENALQELPCDKMPVGEGERKGQFTLHAVAPGKGDTLYLYTDGYADQFGGPQGKKFKYKQLQELLLRVSKEPMEEQKKILAETIRNWKGELEQVDDILVVGIRV